MVWQATRNTKTALGLAVTAVSLTVSLPAPAQSPADNKFVVLPSDAAAMIQNHYALPKSTMDFPLLNWTVFPEYQASPEIRSLLNERVMGDILMKDIANFRNPTDGIVNRLVPTDMTRMAAIDIPVINFRMPTRLAVVPPVHGHENWLVAQEMGEPFILKGDAEAILLASPGTTFNLVADHKIKFKRGRLLTLTGANPVSFATKYGNLKIKPHSCAEIELTAAGLQVTAFDGAPVGLVLEKNNDHAVLAVEAGEKFVVNEAAKLAAVGTSDYVPTTVLEPVPGMSMSREKIAPRSSYLMGQLRLYNPGLLNFAMKQRVHKLIGTYAINGRQHSRQWYFGLNAKAEGGHEIVAYRKSDNSNYYIPRVMKPQQGATRPADPRQVNTVTTHKGVVKYLNGADVVVEQIGPIVLNRGEIFVAADRPARVDAGNLRVVLKEGSMALISRTGDLLRVYNICENSFKSITVQSERRSVAVNAGVEAVVAHDHETIMAILAGDPVARRQVRAVELSGGDLVVQTSEFSIPSLMKSNSMLRQMVKSAKGVDIALTDRIVKMTACLTVVTGGHGQYRRIAGENTGR